VLLVHWRNQCPDELTADLVQYYGFDALQQRPRMMALLASQLPPTSRVHQFDNPDAAWTQDTFLLRQIDISLRSLIYGMCPKDSRGAEPEPVLSPYEQQQKHEKEDIQRQRIAKNREFFGIPENIAEIRG
jgi:hypothetical protein